MLGQGELAASDGCVGAGWGAEARAQAVGTQVGRVKGNFIQLKIERRREGPLL